MFPLFAQNSFEKQQVAESSVEIWEGKLPPWERIDSTEY
jgi:hypothetical protein